MRFQEWFYALLGLNGITDPAAMSVALGVVAAVSFIIMVYVAIRVVQFVIGFFWGNP